MSNISEVGRAYSVNNIDIIAWIRRKLNTADEQTIPVGNIILANTSCSKVPDFGLEYFVGKDNDDTSQNLDLKNWKRADAILLAQSPNIYCLNAYFHSLYYLGSDSPLKATTLFLRYPLLS